MKTNWKCHRGGWGWWGKKHVWSGICRVFLCLFARNLLFPFLLDRANGIQIDVLGIWTLVSQNSTNTNIEKEMGERRQRELFVLTLYDVHVCFLHKHFNFVCGFYFIFTWFIFFLSASLSLSFPLCPSLSVAYSFDLQCKLVLLLSIRLISFSCDQFVSNAIFVVRCLSLIRTQYFIAFAHIPVNHATVALIPTFKIVVQDIAVVALSWTW